MTYISSLFGSCAASDFTSSIGLRLKLSCND